MKPGNRMYDSLANDYDRFVNWSNRLQFEIPFIEKEIRQASPSMPAQVLDTACGTGMHAIALAKLGFACAAADISPKMIQRARSNAKEAGQEIDFKVAGFCGLRQAFDPDRFDALLCLGNSLPHVLSPQELSETLVDFAHCLKPGGLLLIQSRNFDVVMAKQERWMTPEAHADSDGEWLFQRFYDFEPNGLIRFNMINLKRQPASDWRAHVTSTMLYPQTEVLVRSLLTQAGFIRIQTLGSMGGEPFNPETSGNLIFTALRS